MLYNKFTFWAGVVVSTVVLAVLSALFWTNPGLPLHPGPSPKLLSGNITKSRGLRLGQHSLNGPDNMV